MKKVISVILMLALCLAFVSCGSAKTAQDAAKDSTKETQPTQNESTAPDSGSADVPQTDNADAKSVVVYFSVTGNTKKGAEHIAEATGSDIYEIVPKEPYSDDDIDYSNDNCRANKEMNDDSARPEIGGETLDLSGYDTVYLGYPIWWGTMPKIINTFLDKYDLGGKTVMPFCTSGGSGISTSVSAIRNEEPNADVRDGLRVSGSGDSSVDAWISQNTSEK